MSQTNLLPVLQRALRANICTICFQRPSGSEMLDPNTPRSCEGDCTIFVNLPSIKGIADNIEPAARTYVQAVNQFICPACQISPAAGECCPNRAERSCPLNRYRTRVIEILEKIDM